MKVYFNPFAFTIEQNNEFIRLGYEPIPMQIPLASTRTAVGGPSGTEPEEA